MKKVLVNYSFCFVLLFLSLSCKEYYSGPEEIIKPGRRDYAWDYLALNGQNSNEKTYMYITGGAPSDIWVSSRGNYQRLLHYNGASFSEYQGANYSISNLTNFAVPGTQTTWFSTTTGEIFKSEGGALSFFQRISSPDFYNKSCIVDFYGEKSEPLYGAGQKWENDGYSPRGCVWKYENNKWIEQIPLNSQYTYFDDVKYARKNGKGILYLLAKSSSNSYSFAIYECSSNDYKEIYNGYSNGEYIPQMLTMQERVFFFIDNQLLGYTGQNMTVVKDFRHESQQFTQVFGRSYNDLFLFSDEGVFHYDGNNIELVYNRQNISRFANALIFNGEVFFLLTATNGVSFVAHGVLGKSN